MKNMKITLNLSAGLGAILSENPLDGVLAKLYFEKLKKENRFDGDFFMKLPFLEMHPDGFYHISNPQYRVEGVNNYAFYKKFDPEAFESITQKSLPSIARNQASGEYKTHMPRYELSYVKEVVFYCRGDREMIEELLHDLKFIGKKSSHGMGKVSSVVIENIGDDRSIVYNGKLMRPVPLDSDILNGKIDFVPGARLMPPTHPYWDRGREIYMVVPHAGGEALKPNALTDNPPKALAKVFGFDLNYTLAPKHKKYTHIENNDKCKCKMCGRVQESGYMDAKNILIEANTNDFYRYIQPRSPFLCDYCYYNYKNYMRKMQKKLDHVYGDMSNILLFADRFEEKHFNADNKNELYDILKNPPNEPFAVILRELAGTSALNGTYAFLPSVDRRYICVTYGAQNHFVSIDEVFECLERGDEMFAYAKSKKLNLSEEVLYNRTVSENYTDWYSRNLAADDMLYNMMQDWFSRFDRSTRFIAKIILKRWRKEKKDK